MSEITPAVEFSQRLLGTLNSVSPKLTTMFGNTISNLGRSCTTIDDFRKQLNRTLRASLSELQIDTMEIRILLDDNDNIEYWSMNLRNKVIPFLDANLY